MKFLIATFRLYGGDDGVIDMLIGLHKKSWEFLALWYGVFAFCGDEVQTMCSYFWILTADWSGWVAVDN